MRRLALRAPVVVVLFALVAVQAHSEQRRSDPTADVINTLLGALGDFGETDSAGLQKEVAEAGGIAFRAEVPLDYISRAELGRYLKDVFDSEYPESEARADERLLRAFDLLSDDAPLRPLRAKMLEENVAGFYDERPGHKRLYAVSDERHLTPANQLILSHELRHALQDQYIDVHGALPHSIGDFDDRRLAFLALLEGDATFVMERFLLQHLPAEGKEAADVSGLSLPAPSLPDVPLIVRDQLIVPYLAGRDFARSVWERDGWEGIRAAWSHPPQSSEQVLHPEKYFAHEEPISVEAGYTPPGGVLLRDGVLGEVFVRTLLGEAAEEAAAGWGGDHFRVWDLAGKTLLVWRSRWDRPEDAREFLVAALARFRDGKASEPPRAGFVVFGHAPWQFAWGERDGSVLFAASDAATVLRAALDGLSRENRSVQP